MRNILLSFCLIVVMLAGGSMQVGDGLARALNTLNNGGRLSPQEIEALRFELNRVQGNQPYSTMDLTIDTLNANRVDLNNEPGRPVIVYWFDSGNLINIPTGTWTPLDFTDARLTVKQDAVPIVRFDGAKIYINEAFQQESWFIGMHGRIAWSYHNIGVRSTAIAYYDVNDVLITRRSISITPAVGTSYTTGGVNMTSPLTSPLEVTRPVPLTYPNEGGYFKIEVFQDSNTTIGVYAIDLTFTLDYK